MEEENLSKDNTLEKYSVSNFEQIENDINNELNLNENNSNHLNNINLNDNDCKT